MADNVTLPGTGAPVATDDIGGFHYQRVKLADGTADSSTPINAASGVAANALRTVSSTDDPILGALTETAPATDTASSGLNGRAQRIAQRLSSLIALIPAALGAGGGMKVQVYNAAGTAVDPLPPGSTTDSASVPIAFSTEGKASLGALTETAPATDTASSGLNGRLQRIAQRLTTIAAGIPAALGSTAAASSQSVAQSTEDIARAGIITETAPATDTASSGLNGRLQRIAQRLTSLITLVPTALGANGGLKIEGVASGTVVPVTGTITAVTALTNALPAGTNNIGDVDVLTLPALVAGTANIGDVDVLTVPADPFGVNADAASLTTSISAKLKGIATALGITALDLGTGTGGTRTLRFFKDTAQWIGGSGANGTAVQRVTIATDDTIVAPIGAVGETAPASDTASSGLNGRLQRIAQRITSLIALVPAALGAGGGFKVQMYNAAGSAVDPLPPGSTTDSASCPVAWSTEGKAQIGSLTETAPATDTASSGLNGRLQRIAQRLTSLIALVPTTLGSAAASASFAVTASTEDIARVGIITETAPASDTASSGLNGRLQRIAQRITSLIALWTTTGLSNKGFSVAFTTLTRQANTTPYTALDSISDNSTAGSVTALSATVSDTNDDPVFIADILINSTDTGLAGKKLRANLFNSDPTASTGVGAGDNVAYSQKKAGYIGTLVGTLETGFSDGTVGRLVPSFRDTNYTPAGGFIVALPTSGAKTVYIQFVAEEAFTPSANSTTIIARARGWQGRAA